MSYELPDSSAYPFTYDDDRSQLDGVENFALSTYDAGPYLYSPHEQENLERTVVDAPELSLFGARDAYDDAFNAQLETTIEEGSRPAQSSWYPNHLLAVPNLPSSSAASYPTSLLAEDLTGSSDILLCSESECDVKFHGRHGKGNLARHKRLYHRPNSRPDYICRDIPCAKQFRRPDARLKHERKHHPHLFDDMTSPRSSHTGDMLIHAHEEISSGRVPRALSLSMEHHRTGGHDLSLIETLHESENMSSTATLGCSIRSPDPRELGQMIPVSELTTITNSSSHANSVQVADEKQAADKVPAADDYRLKCSSCSQSFRRGTDLRRHMRRHEPKQFLCKVSGCVRGDRGFYRMDKLRDHVRISHQGEITTNSEGTVQFHVNENPDIAEQPESYNCLECNIVFERKSQLTDHQNRKHIRRFKCDLCSADFNLKADLTRHQQTRHNVIPDRRFFCTEDTCSSSFNRRDALTRHLKHTHSKDASGNDASSSALPQPQETLIP